MEMVNMMANGKDVRLFSYTEAVMDEVKHNFGEDDDMPDNIKDFINFLRRRRGYAFINFNQLDKAEKIFTQMLNEEDNADYAIRELAHINFLRQRNENADAHTGEQESNDDDGETHPIKPPF
jgi:lipopolysaccharide biosynthesis regulator YciM